MRGLREEICWAAFLALVIERRADEGGEKRMRLERLGFEFGVELAAEEVRMARYLHDLNIG